MSLDLFYSLCVRVCARVCMSVRVHVYVCGVHVYVYSWVLSTGVEVRAQCGGVGSLYLLCVFRRLVGLAESPHLPCWTCRCHF